MIDVIFLLLLFFMLASTFSKHAEIELVAGAGSAASGSEPSNIVALLVLPDALQINGAPVDEAAFVSRIEDALSAPNSIVALQLSGQVTTQRLVDVLLQLRALPNPRIQIVGAS